jgi:CheY-like chemotaxis protein
MDEIKKDILWIDDDINTMALKPFIVEMEEEAKFNVTKAATPEEAFNAIGLHHSIFAAIIVDISMPLGESIDFTEAKAGTQTGLVLLKKIAVIPECIKIPLIVFTIVNDQEVKQYCDENNIPYLSKRRELPDTFVDKLKANIK